MNWIRTNYERMLLIAAVAVLFVCSIFIWRNAASFASSIGHPRENAIVHPMVRVVQCAGAPAHHSGAAAATASGGRDCAARLALSTLTS